MRFDLTKVRFIVADKMRYGELGDYLDNKVVAYNTGKKEYVQAVLLHELVELALIKALGIPVSWIDRFDTDKLFRLKKPRAYEQYRVAHYLATLVERQFIENLGLSWEKYEDCIRKIKIKVDRKRLKYNYEGKKKVQNRRLR